MDMTHQPIFWAELAAIIWINLLVSGDNAVMIALALQQNARNRIVSEGA